MSKTDKRMLQDALESKVLELRKGSSGVADLKKRCMGDVHCIFNFFFKRRLSTGFHNISVEASQDQGPVDFRKALRKTTHAATDSLKKRGEWSSQEN